MIANRSCERSLLKRYNGWPGWIKGRPRVFHLTCGPDAPRPVNAYDPPGSGAPNMGWEIGAPTLPPAPSRLQADPGRTVEIIERLPGADAALCGAIARRRQALGAFLSDIAKSDAITPQTKPEAFREGRKADNKLIRTFLEILWAELEFSNRR